MDINELSLCFHDGNGDANRKVMRGESFMLISMGGLELRRAFAIDIRNPLSLSPALSITLSVCMPICIFKHLNLHAYCHRFSWSIADFLTISQWYNLHNT